MKNNKRILRINTKLMKYFKRLGVFSTNQLKHISLILTTGCIDTEWLHEIICESKLNYLTNPYYFGLGNPKAKTLVCGLETAYNYKERPQKFIDENVLNHKNLWKDNDKINLQNLVDFEKELNCLYYREESARWKAGHFFGWLQRLLEVGDNEGVFSRCFITELHSTPSPKTKALPLCPERANFLKVEPFFRDFETVVIAARSSLRSTVKKSGLNTYPFDLFGFQFSMDQKGVCYDGSGRMFELVQTLENGTPVIQQTSFRGRTLIITGNLSGAGRYHPNIDLLRQCI